MGVTLNELNEPTIVVGQLQEVLGPVAGAILQAIMNTKEVFAAFPLKSGPWLHANLVRGFLAESLGGMPGTIFLEEGCDAVLFEYGPFQLRILKEPRSIPGGKASLSRQRANEHWQSGHLQLTIPFGREIPYVSLLIYWGLSRNANLCSLRLVCPDGTINNIARERWSHDLTGFIVDTTQPASIENNEAGDLEIKRRPIFGESQEDIG